MMLIKIIFNYSQMQKKVDKMFSAAWSSLPVFRFWSVADNYCILGCLAECKKNEKFSVLKKIISSDQINL
jgi:hypothetical protein